MMPEWLDSILKGILWAIMGFVVTLLICMLVGGCVVNEPMRPKTEQEFIRFKLQGITQMNNQLGAMIGYNAQKFNSHQFKAERWMWINQHLVPKT